MTDDEPDPDPTRIAGVDPTDHHDHTIDLALEAHQLQQAQQPPGVPDGAARDDELPPIRQSRRLN
jgi:hypothetical protein